MTHSNELVEIPRFTQLDSDAFYQDYFKTKQPVILTDTIKQWPALSKWTPEYLKSLAPDKRFYVEEGNVFQCNPNQNTTFTFSNPPISGRSGAFTLVWFQDSTDRTITWPGAVDWPGGSAPDVTSGSGKCDIYTFFTLDAGTTWFGFQAGAEMS